MSVVSRFNEVIWSAMVDDHNEIFKRMQRTDIDARDLSRQAEKYGDKSIDPAKVSEVVVALEKAIADGRDAGIGYPEDLNELARNLKTIRLRSGVNRVYSHTPNGGFDARRNRFLDVIRHETADTLGIDQATLAALEELSDDDIFQLFDEVIGPIYRREN